MFNLKNYICKIFFLIKGLLLSKKIFFNPPQKKYLIYDRIGSEFIIPYLNNKDYSILDTRRESINISVLIYSILKNGFKNLFLNYVTTYINFVKPKMVITTINTDIRFYLVKEKLNFDSKFISIQNGLFGTQDEFSSIKKFKKIYKKKLICDYFLCQNNYLKKKIEKHIKTKCILIGSLRNNFIDIAKRKKNHITFISQYIPTKENNSIMYQKNKIKITHNDANMLHLNVLKNILYFFSKKNKLCILLRDVNVRKQVSFYKQNLKDFNNCYYFYIPRNNIDNYKFLDGSKMVIFVDSFLGYEAFARGIKILSFSLRSNKFKLNAYNFAYNYYGSNGLFWSNKINKKVIKNKLNKILSIEAYKWKLIKKKLEKNIIVYDNGNSKLKKLIKSVS